MIIVDRPIVKFKLDSILMNKNILYRASKTMRNFGVKVIDAMSFYKILNKYRIFPFRHLLYGESHYSDNKRTQFLAFLDISRINFILHESRKHDLSFDTLLNLTWDRVEISGYGINATITYPDANSNKQLVLGNFMIPPELKDDNKYVFKHAKYSRYKSQNDFEVDFNSEMKHKINISADENLLFQRLTKIHTLHWFIKYFTVDDGLLVPKKDYEQEVINDHSRKATKDEEAIFREINNVANLINKLRKKYHPHFLRNTDIFDGPGNWDIDIRKDKVTINQEVFEKRIY